MEYKQKAILDSIDAKDLLRLSIFQTIAAPHPDSPLISRKKNFIYKLVENKVKRINPKDLPEDVDFDAPIGTGIAIIFGELVRIAAELYKDPFSIPRVWGFDLKHLPDMAYLLKAIAIWDPQSPIIKSLPRKPTNSNKDLEKFVSEALGVYVNQTLEKKIKFKPTSHNFEDIKNHIKRIEKIATAYNLSRNLLANTREQIKDLVEAAQTDPILSEIIYKGGITKIASSEAFMLEKCDQEKAQILHNAHENSLKIEYQNAKIKLDKKSSRKTFTKQRNSTTQQIREEEGNFLPTNRTRQLSKRKQTIQTSRLKNLTEEKNKKS